MKFISIKKDNNFTANKCTEVLQLSAIWRQKYLWWILLGTEHVSGVGASDEQEWKILGGAVSFLNSLERNWSSTAQVHSSAGHIISRPARVRVACLHECAQHGGLFCFVLFFLNYNKI